MTTGNEDAPLTVQHRSSSILVPSFGTGDDQNVENGVKISLSPRSTNTSACSSGGLDELGIDTRRQAIQIDMKKLSRIEHALQFYFSRSRNRRESPSINFNDFYNLLELRDKDCRHEILCVLLTVVPQLYKIQAEVGRIELPGFGPKSNINRVRQLKDAWKRTEGRYDHPREQSLVGSLLASRRGVRTLSILKCWADNNVASRSKRSVTECEQNCGFSPGRDAHKVGLPSKKKHRREVVEVTPTQQQQQQQLEPFITANMTLEERVRARAEAKERNEKRQDDLSNSSAATKADGETCKEELLQLADALRSHFRANVHIGAMRTAATIRELSRHLVGALNSVKFGGSRAKRKDVIEKLFKLAKVLPEWISIKGTSMKHSVLTMKTDVDFVKSVRTKLGGQYRQQKSGLNCVDVKPAQAALTNQIFAASMPPPCPRRNKVKGEASLAPVNKLIDVNVSSLERKKFSPAQRKSVIHHHTRKKTQQTLRINKDLIFGHRLGAEPMPGDADFVTKKSVCEIGDCRSQNGLKRLFSEMNNGRRI